VRNPIATVLLGSVALLAACADVSMMTNPSLSVESPTVLGVSPANAATGVDLAQPVVLTFSGPMMPGMETLVVLHEGTLAGPAVAGVATWSADRTVLTFTPSAPLKRNMTYVLHLAPSLMGASGRPINLDACARLGGRYATGGMMGVSAGTGMTNGAWRPGMMGDGWRAADGTFGMFFSFTTA